MHVTVLKKFDSKTRLDYISSLRDVQWIFRTCALRARLRFNLFLVQTESLTRFKLKTHLSYRTSALIRVRTTGFEPAHLMAPPPQDGMSTNFTTWAFGAQK